YRAVPDAVVERRHFIVAELITVDARGLLSGRRRLGEGRGRHGGCGERGAGQQRPATDFHPGGLPRQTAIIPSNSDAGRKFRRDPQACAVRGAASAPLGSASSSSRRRLAGSIPHRATTTIWIASKPIIRPSTPPTPEFLNKATTMKGDTMVAARPSVLQMPFA